MKKSEQTIDNLTAGLVSEVLNTKETRRVLGIILPELINLIAGCSEDPNRSGAVYAVKKKTVGFVGKKLGKSISRADGKKPAPAFSELLANAQFLEKLKQMQIELLADTDKTDAWIKSLMDSIGSGSGKAIKNAAIKVDELHKKNPEHFAEMLKSPFTCWLTSMDFAELKLAVENSEKDIESFARMVSDMMWSYPTKSVLLLSLMPNIVNIISTVLSAFISGLTDKTPDLLTDIILSYLKEIKPESIYQLLNQLTELSRKIHVGSALLGEPGVPELPRVIAPIIDQVVEGLDIEVWWKARLALGEIKSSLGKVIEDAVEKKEGFQKLGLEKRPELNNMKFRSWNRILSRFDGMDDTELADSMEASLAAYDIQELTESFNQTVRLANRIRDQKPGLLLSMVQQMTSMIDIDELSEFFNGITGDVGEELRPLARAIVPKMVLGLCEVLNPDDDDENEEEATRARDALRTLLFKEEV